MVVDRHYHQPDQLYRAWVAGKEWSYDAASAERHFVVSKDAKEQPEALMSGLAMKSAADCDSLAKEQRSSSEVDNLLSDRLAVVGSPGIEVVDKSEAVRKVAMGSQYNLSDHTRRSARVDATLEPARMVLVFVAGKGVAVEQGLDNQVAAGSV